MNAQLGPAAPAAGSAESEALRRYRSFLCGSLVRGESAPPALDGLRLNERRVMALIEAWTAAAGRTLSREREALAERDARDGARLDLAGTFAPFRDSFRTSLRQSSGTRKQRGRPRVTRRAVSAAIDRVGDAFLAVDTENGEIADANPAAGALLGVNRDALLGVDAMRFVPSASRDGWWTQIDAMTEDDATRAFDARLVDVGGSGLEVEATITRFVTKGRVLALLMLRPRGPHPSPARSPAQPGPGPARRPLPPSSSPF